MNTPQLEKLFQRFIKESPSTVMARSILERMMPTALLDNWFDERTEKQYTRELLFSTVFNLMVQVVCGIRHSVCSAYQANEEDIPVSIQSVYNKLNGLETQISADLVRHSAMEGEALIEELKGARTPLLPGYRVKMLDGNCIEASEHRLKELRNVSGGALPGKSLVVFDPRLDLAVDVFPCEDGHAQERSLLNQVLLAVEANDVWIADRNFCVRSFLFGVIARDGFFIVREHAQLPWTAISELDYVGEVETGLVFEQTVSLCDEQGNHKTVRRIQVRLHNPTRDGDNMINLFTNLPVTLSALLVSELYRERWKIETAFQVLEKNFNSEINTLGYPKAALFGFCTALVAYNTLAVLQGVLRAVHGEKVDSDLSSYYLAEELGATYRGMMIAIPPDDWALFETYSLSQMASILLELAEKIRLSAYRKHKRGPKKPKIKPPYDPKHPHVSTAKLIATRTT